jgi:septal ring factor EnvC (AmiA/AmiB activator)
MMHQERKAQNRSRKSSQGHRFQSSNQIRERHTHAGTGANSGYMRDHERKQSLRNKKQSEFDQIVKKIDRQMATNRAKRSKSKGYKLGS